MVRVRQWSLVRLAAPSVVNVNVNKLFKRANFSHFKSTEIDSYKKILLRRKMRQRYQLASQQHQVILAKFNDQRMKSWHQEEILVVCICQPVKFQIN